MLRYENSQTNPDINSLMQMAAALGELTGHLEDLPRIPKILAGFLGLDLLTFALVRVDRAEPEILTFASSDPVGGVRPATLLPASVLIRDILEIARRRESNARTTPALADDAALNGSDVSSDSPRQVVLTRHIDAAHRMILIVHQGPNELSLDRAATDMLHILCNHLAYAIRLLLGAMEYPPTLGEDFRGITEREWTVLWGLNSADGEKQLADRMGLSPHTLHSHIKSIYRKLGVQGRLPLTQRLRLALQDYRLRVLPVVLPPSPVERAAC